MRIKAHAKINLALDVVKKRADGYHELKTVFYETALYDELIFEKSDITGIRLETSDKELSCGQDNLIYKAARLVFDEYKLPGGIDIYLDKRIPTGAGLGGGSSDAAATLKALNEIYELNIEDSKLKALAAGLGADVPFFISGGAAYATGIGEELTHIDVFKPLCIVLAKPGTGVSTAQAYKAVDAQDEPDHPDAGALFKALKSGNYEEICKNTGNTFEKPIFGIHPFIEELKKAFLKAGADAAAMTGSGSAVFGLFEKEEDSIRAAELLRSSFADVAIYLNNGELL